MLKSLAESTSVKGTSGPEVVALESDAEVTGGRLSLCRL